MRLNLIAAQKFKKNILCVFHYVCSENKKREDKSTCERRSHTRADIALKYRVHFI